jgi:hypothetical protein
MASNACLPLLERFETLCSYPSRPAYPLQASVWMVEIKLQEANRAKAERHAQVERRESSTRSESERRARLFEAAKQGLVAIASELQIALEEAAPAARDAGTPGGGWSLSLENARLQLASPELTAPKSPLPFIVIAHSSSTCRSRQIAAATQDEATRSGSVTLRMQGRISGTRRPSYSRL